MKIQKTVQLIGVAVLAVTMTACSTFRGPRPIDPNDDKQFENLPPAPAVEALPSTDTTSAAPAAAEEASPPVIAESAPEAPETGSANLGNPIESSAIATEPVSVVDAAPAAAATVSKSTDSLNDLLKIRVYYFGTNLSDITAISYGSLNAHARYLATNPQAKLQISGHTDERGTREYNLALGERRANTVARYLVGAGVNPGQLSVVSYGKEKPVAEGSSEEAWAKNRRVELDYVSGVGSSQ